LKFVFVVSKIFPVTFIEISFRQPSRCLLIFQLRLVAICLFYFFHPSFGTLDHSIDIFDLLFTLLSSAFLGEIIVQKVILTYVLVLWENERFERHLARIFLFKFLRDRLLAIRWCLTHFLLFLCIYCW